MQTNTLTNTSLNVHHLTRVEGHGNIVVDVTKGKVEKVQWQVPEAPRFFEAMVRGRHYTEVALAKEIHDSIGASLTAIKLSLERKLEAMKRRSAVEDIQIEDIISMVHRTIRETKRMQQALRPPILDDLGIIATVRSLCREFQQANPSIELRPAFNADEENIPEHVKIVIYRISQESLNNITKHSHAESASR